MKKKVLFSILIMAVLLMCSAAVNAEGVSITATNLNPKVGDKVTVNVGATAATWNLTVSGDKIQGKTYVQNPLQDLSEITTNYSFEFDTSKAGTYVISLTGDYTGVAGNTIDGINKNVTITVTDPTPETQPTEPETPLTTPETPTESTTPTEPVKSSNADLNNLGIEPNDFSGFKPGKTEYNVTVPKNVESVKVYASKANEKATVEGTGNRTLEIGENILEVTVTAEDGTVKKYVMNVTRSETEEEKSTNSKLRSVTVTPIGLTPEFDKDKLEYTLNVANDIEEIKISATKDDDKAKYEVIGNTGLKEGENEVKVVVTAEDGTKTTYVIKVTRASKEGFGLKELTLLGITKERKNLEIYLSPDFKNDVTEYICKLEENVSSISVTAVSAKEDATVEVLGDKELEIGENTITIMVKSADGKETKTYQIVIANPSVEETLTTGITNSVTNGESDNNDMKKVIYIVCIALIALMGIVYAVIEYRHRKNGKKGNQEIDYDYDFVEDYVNKNPESVSEVNRFSKAFLEGLEKDNINEEEKSNINKQEDEDNGDEEYDDESDEFTYKPDTSFEDNNSFDEDDDDDDNSHRGRRTGRRFK